MCNKIVAPAAGPGSLFTSRIFLQVSFLFLCRYSKLQRNFCKMFLRHDDRPSWWANVSPQFILTSFLCYRQKSCYVVSLYFPSAFRQSLSLILPSCPTFYAGLEIPTGHRQFASMPLSLAAMPLSKSNRSRPQYFVCGRGALSLVIR